MTASTVVMIVLRLFALYWAETMVPFVQQVAYQMGSLSRSSTGDVLVGQLIVSGLLLVIFLGIIVGCWTAAPALARWITRKDDPIVQISGLTLEDLFAFGFIFVGLWFALGAVGRCVWYLYHYWTFAVATSVRQQYLTAPGSEWIIWLVQLLVAGVLLFNARKLAGKLLRSQS